MAKSKKKKRKVKKTSKLKIWSLIFMYLVSLMLVVASILDIAEINVPYYSDATETQNMMVLILSVIHLIFIIISNVGVKTVNIIMFINSVFLAILIIISFKFLLIGCIISVVLVVLDLFYLCTIYENSKKS